MRFAGTAISSFAGSPGMESFLDPNRPDAGEIAMTGDNIRAKESTVGTELQGRTVAKGISAAGEVEAAKINAQGQQALASAQGNASMMRGIGGIASSLVGAIPTGGGGAGSIGTGAAFGQAGTVGSDRMAFGGYTAAQDRTINNGGFVDHGYL